MRHYHPGRRGFWDQGPRRGMISVAVLVCLLVITLIFGSLLRLVQSQRALVRNEGRRLQADWLAESGLDRAAARLGDDPAYRGENWTLPADELGIQAPGVVTITVERRKGAANQRLVTVQADYPRDPPRRARSRRQMIVDVGPGRAGATP
jgi:type II secretory pathway component PulK